MVDIEPTSSGRFAGMVNQATREGYYLESKVFNDILIDIAGVYFPLKNFRYEKALTVDEEWGSGSHLPFNLLNKQIGFSGNFSYGTYLRSAGERHALHSLLEDQQDEGQSKFFNIIILDREGDSPDQYRTGGATQTAGPVGDFVEALILSKVTTSGRDYPENNTVITSHNFKSLARIPL